MKIYSFNSELNLVTGVEKVTMDVHHAMRTEYDAMIVGTLPFDKISKDHKIAREEYIRLRNPFMFRNSVVIVHERKFLIVFWLLNKLMFQNIKVVYVHHNIFNNLNRWTVLPKYIVSISDRVTQNLTEFFGADPKNITKIYNCVEDIQPASHKIGADGDYIKVLYPARINDTKRQVKIVEKLKGKLDSRIKILFAGSGPRLDDLKYAIGETKEFETLGYRSDVHQLLQECDYMMLFSKHEGLPITLIEADMCGTPIVCNDVGGNAEIAVDGVNAFVAPSPDDYEWLIATLNSLPDIKKEEYKRMSENGRKIYEENFTFDKFKANYLNLIKKVIC